MKKLTLLIISAYLMLFAVFITDITRRVSAQQKATSNCIKTQVGNPKGNSTPPSGCEKDTSKKPGGTPSIPSAGQFGFPLKDGIEIVTSINTEMASYAGDFSNCMQGTCHAEHAGLDIMTPPGGHIDAIAVADGQVITSGDASSCAGIDWGCRVEVLHDDGKIISAYVHVDPTVSANGIIKKGDRVGYVHVWPASYGPGMDHLHFELRDDRGYNINPRNYYEEFNRFPPAPGYAPTVREHTANRSLPWIADDKEFGETFLNHPPCSNTSDCWAH